MQSLQDYNKIGTIRLSTIVTTSYVPATTIDNKQAAFEADVPRYNQLVLFINVTLGSLTSAQVKIEASPDGGTTWFQETLKTQSGNTSTDTLLEHSYGASGNYLLTIPIKYEMLRVSVKGTGTVTSSLVQVDAALGTV